MIDLRLGDCLDVLATLPDNSVDAVITSPPYAMQRRAHYGGVEEADYPAWTVAWMAEVRRVLVPMGSVLINIREHIRDGEMAAYVLHTRLALRAAGWIECDELIWVKPAAPPVGHPNRPRRSWERILWFSPSRRCHVYPKANGKHSNHIGLHNSPNHSGGTRHPKLFGPSIGYGTGISRCTDVVTMDGNRQVQTHPAAYPVPLAAWMLRLVTPPGGTVLDPFMGSGTTGVACLLEGRSFIGIERDPAYFAICERRLADAQRPLTA